MSRRINQWPEQPNGRIAVAFLPLYASELYPVEAIWRYLKKNEIANLCPHSISELSDYARRRHKSMQRRLRPMRAFWELGP